MDMSGNVWEWVNTIYGTSKYPYPYKFDDGRDSDGDTNSSRVLRGGSWLSNANSVRAANRDGISPDNEDSLVGSRCARSLVY
jgi:formylglycine-generating enzyme required for sulfatase activity